MKIRESITFKTTTIASLKQYDMFVLDQPRCMVITHENPDAMFKEHHSSPKVIYMYIMTYTGPKYLELSNGTWKDSNVIFSVVEQVSIISIEDLVYSKGNQ